MKQLCPSLRMQTSPRLARGGTLLEQLVLRKAQREQKSLVDQKGKSFLDFDFQ